MRFEEYRGHDAIGLAKLVASKSVSPSELLDLALARTKEVNPLLNAVVRLQEDQARGRAAIPLAGRFAGVPFLTKDLLQPIAGVPMGWGTRAARAEVQWQDADVVRRWQEAGVIIFGQTNTPELGLKNITEPKASGPTCNPWQFDLTPGGSSGGSAASIAAGIVPCAGANDGGGSIRIPAGSCGLVGLKPSRGLIGVGPDVGDPFFGGISQGVLSRSVRDTALMLDLLKAPSSSVSLSDTDVYLQTLQRQPSKLRIAYSWKSPAGLPSDPEAVAAINSTAKLLESLGHHVEEAYPDIDGEQMLHDWTWCWYAMTAFGVRDLCRNHGANWRDFELDTKLMAAMGSSLRADRLVEIHSRWQTYAYRMRSFFCKYDFWMVPTTNGPAPRIGAYSPSALETIVSEVLLLLGCAGAVGRLGAFDATIKRVGFTWTPHTQLANITGLPAISLPLHWTKSGLPLGVQFVGPIFSDQLLLQLSAQLEKASPWFHRVPTVAARSIAHGSVMDLRLDCSAASCKTLTPPVPIRPSL